MDEVQDMREIRERKSKKELINIKKDKRLYNIIQNYGFEGEKERQKNI